MQCAIIMGGKSTGGVHAMRNNNGREINSFLLQISNLIDNLQHYVAILQQNCAQHFHNPADTELF